MPRFPLNRQRGLTLPGTLVAVIVLASAIIAGTRLLARTQHTVGISRDQFLAANLAQEGLELLYAQRDNNWYADPPRPWADSICVDQNPRTFFIDRDPAGGVIISTDGTGRLYTTSDGRYTLDSAGQTASPFTRVITVDCSRFEVTPAPADPTPDDPGLYDRNLTATSAVTWQRAGESGPRSSSLKAVLYDWYSPPAP